MWCRNTVLPSKFPFYPFIRSTTAIGLPLFCSYTQETPLRFKKEIVAAAKDSNDRIVMANLQKVLHNIGASQKMTAEELRLIFAEIGDAGAIPAERMVKLL